MHGSPHRHLDRFKVQSSCFPQLLKDETEQPGYFALDFLPDRFRRFFSCGVSVSSTGLARQIFSLTSSSSWLSSRNR
jgi:hypothetical protein